MIAVLELRERQKGGQILNVQLVKNAYGKDNRLDVQIQKSEILYIDPNKKRTNGWLQGLGLQLPSDTTNCGSVGSIFYPDGFVKMDGVMYAELVNSSNADTRVSLPSDDILNGMIARHQAAPDETLASGARMQTQRR